MEGSSSIFSEYTMDKLKLSLLRLGEVNGLLICTENMITRNSLLKQIMDIQTTLPNLVDQNPKGEKKATMTKFLIKEMLVI